ncbi:MAG TPA: hypothetical protein VF502_08055 [Stellaceae bacterium]
MTRPYRIPGILLGMALALAPTAASADDQPLSPAQIALFESDHLKDISRPVRLEYAFQHRGGDAGDYADKVTIDIRDINRAGGKDVAVEFLTGEHRMNFPPVTGFHGNPLLMYFLEHDVVEMRDATGGAATYFRNRIRRAFVDAAEMHPVEVTVDGGKRSGTEIVIAPFRGDPHVGRIPGFADKTYRFVLCDAVPGAIYQISTAALGAGSAPKAFEESMTYAGEHDEKP